MTILGAEFANRQAAFISQLTARNTVSKIDTGARVQQTAESFLRGLGGSYESMLTLDPNTVNSENQMPPYRYIKNDWKRQFSKWIENYNFNKDATTDKYKIDIDSKFIVKEDDVNADEINTRNALQGEGTKDEAKYLFDVEKNCSNIIAKVNDAPHNKANANYSRLAEQFDQEVQLLKRQKGMCTNPDDCIKGSPLKLKTRVGKDVEFYFLGPFYKYENLDSFAKICLYDREINRGLPTKE